ncbi:unnamed protein product [Acanthoscelides obtectus]|uniref:Uncharacterized protein n=1 Tax=Acanthoscelides obtectus TaxID=200917 RepID=A0A9P0LGW4_ACAOB|nr:unnamed protein product [Acanthoscelides obtectus]CAK1649080.1 hypothetical protein AOBTE_LOCUS16024 [Acanthoscelides obtectus]
MDLVIVFPILRSCSFNFLPCLDETAQTLIQTVQTSYCLYVFHLEKHDRALVKTNGLHGLICSTHMNTIFRLY